MASITRTLKRIILLMLTLLLFLLSGCFKHHTKCPYDYPGSIWESDSPHIVLSINEENVISKDSSDPYAQAFLEIDGEMRKVHFCVEPITMCAPIYDYEICEEAGALVPEALLLDTECLYFKNMIVMRIVEDNVYDGEYKIVILKRTK